MTKHAAQRAHQRFGVQLDRESIDTIVADIEEGRAFKIGAADEGCELWLVRLPDGRRVRAVYQPDKHIIRTFKFLKGDPTKRI